MDKEKNIVEDYLSNIMIMSDKFITCLTNVYNVNNNTKKNFKTQKGNCFNPKMLVFKEPSDKKGKKVLKVRNSQIYGVEGIGEGQYNTNKRDGSSNTLPEHLKCEDLIISIIYSLTYYLAMPGITFDEFLNLIDLMSEGLYSLKNSIRKDLTVYQDIELLLAEFSNLRNEKMNQQYGSEADNQFDYESSYKQMDIFMTVTGMDNALNRISEDAPNGDKIRFYVNTIMVRLILTMYINQLKKEDIPFFEFFNEHIYDSFKKDSIHYSKLIEFMDNRDFPFESKDEIELKKYLLSCDIDFWISCIGKVPEKPKYKCLNSLSKNYLNTITYRLKYYRNIVAHSGDNDPSDEMVVRTLRTIHDFACKCGLREEALLIEKHLCFELYRCYGYKTECQIRRRYDMDFSNYQFPKYEEITCWKNNVSLKVNINDSLFAVEDDDNKSIGVKIKELFFGSVSCDESISKKIMDYYWSRGVSLPYVSLLGGFEKQISECYPFHPCFFLLIKELEVKDQIEIARRAIEKAYGDKNYNNTLIMPYEIDLEYKPIEDILIDMFSTEEERRIRDKQFYKIGWSYAKDVMMEEPLQSDLVFFRTNYISYLQISKTIVLLNLRELYRKKERAFDKDDWFNSKICANKEWVRLCSFQPSKEETLSEGALNLLMFDNILLKYTDAAYFDKKTSTLYKTRLYKVLFPNDATIKKNVSYMVEKRKMLEKTSRNSLKECRKVIYEVADKLTDEFIEKYENNKSEYVKESIREEYRESLIKRQKKTIESLRKILKERSELYLYLSAINSFSDYTDDDYSI